MKIWIDGYEANVIQRLGSSQVAFELLKGLEKEDFKNDYTILLPNPPVVDLPKERTGWKYKILKPKKLWTRIALPLVLFSAKQKPDIFFSPTHYLPRFVPKGVKKVVTIFDLSFLHFPEMFTKKDLWQLKNWTNFSAQNADHILTISKFSKDDILKQYKISKDKVTVAYPGYDRESFKPQGEKQDNYIIYIGTIQPRKNLIKLMEAVSRIENLNLMIVGKSTGEGRQGWMYDDILKTPKQLGIEDRIKFLGFIPTEELITLLSGATAYIQPSLWEGFGIPVVEAMATGVPVIVSKVSSLPEVAGQAGLLVDPYSVDQIEQAIRTIVSDKKLQQKFSKAGLVQSKKFSWDKMAKQVIKIFENLKT